jgi:hypothetical protein
MDLDGIWYGRDAIEGYPRVVLLKFPRVGNTNMADDRSFEVGLTLAPLTIGSYNDVTEIELRKIHNCLTVILCSCKTTWWLHEK